MGEAMTPMNPQDLRTITHECGVPFSVRIGADFEPLVCTELLRVLPGKRIVCKATFRSAPVIAKIFVDPVHAVRHLKREVDGLNALYAADITAPEIIHKTTLAGGAIVLITQYLEDAVPLSALFETPAGEETRKHILEKVCKLIARLHKAGLAQNDLHLDNYLQKDEVLYCVDGSTIDHSSQGKPLAWKKSINNLGLFFAQFSDCWDPMISTGWASYLREHDQPVGVDWQQKLQKAIDRHRRRRKRIFLSKIFRNCTEFVCQKNIREYWVCVRTAYTPAMQQLLQDPDRAIEKGQIVKRGGSSTVAQIVMDQQSLIVKRYNIKNWIKRIQRLILPRRVRIAWRNSHLLRFLGIATAKPIAMLEKRYAGLPTVGYIISEFLSGPDARDLTRQSRTEGTPFEPLVPKISELLESLARHRIGHSDLKATNMILVDDRFVIIDLDGLRVYNHWRYQRALRKDWLRLLKNWQDWPELYETLQDRILSILLRYDPRGLMRCCKPQWQNRGMRMWWLGPKENRSNENELAELLFQGERLTGKKIEILKRDIRRFVFRLCQPEKNYLIKSFPLHRLKDKRRYVRYAHSELRNNLWARELGISVPQCYGFFEIRRFQRVQNCGVVMEDLAGYQTLTKRLTEDPKALMAAIPILVLLYQRGVNHVDITPSNIFFREDLSEYKIIDWQYCAFGPVRQDLQLVIQAAHFLQYARITTKNTLWETWLRQLHTTSGCAVSWQQFQRYVKHLQGRKNAISDRLHLRAANLGIES